MLLMLSTMSGCGTAPSPTETPSPDPPPPAAAPAPAPSAPRAAPSAYPAVFANKYLVIVATAKTEAELVEAERKLSPAAALEPFRLRSTDFAGLRPCWELLVARALPDRDEALRYSEGLKAAGVASYVRGTGTYVGHVAGRASACIDGGAGDAWMVDGDTIPLAGGGPAVGDRLRVVSLDGARDAVCSVASVDAYTVEGDPSGQGVCERQVHEATLDPACPGGDFAVREGAPRPIVYREVPAGEIPADVVAELTASLLASDEVRQMRSGLAAAAEDRPMTETVAPIRAWTGPAGRVVTLRVDGYAPFAERVCGMDGEAARVHQAVLLASDGRRIPLFTAPGGGQSAVEHFVDLDADGRPEAWWTDYRDGGETAWLDGTAAPVEQGTPWCGCPC